MIYQVLKCILSQSTDPFNDQTVLLENIYILFVPKFTLYNHLQNFHAAFIYDIFV